MRLRLFAIALCGLATPLLLGGCAGQCRNSGAPGHAGRLVVHEERGESLLLIHSFGSSPRTTGAGRLRGNGLEVILVDSRSEVEVLRDVITELDFDIDVDYSHLEDGVLMEVFYTYDPRASAECPFLIRRCSRAVNGTYEQSERVVLEGEEGDARRIADLVRAVMESDAGSPEQESAMAHLRNIGIDRPDEMLRLMDDMSAHLGSADNDMLSLFARELECARAAEGRRKENRDD